MRTLKYMVLALIFLFLVAFVVGLFLPSKINMSRSIIIDRSPEKIYKVIHSLKNFNHWSPWVEKDKQAKFTYTGADFGVGSKMIWSGNSQLGQGSQEIIQTVENQSVRTNLYFGKSQQPALASLTLTPENNNTKVTWSFEREVGGDILARYFGLATEDLLAPDYELGLSNLKKYVENLPLFDYSNISIVQTPVQAVYQVEGQTSMDQQQISKTIADSYAKIIAFLGANNVVMNGSPKIINKKYKDNEYQFIAAIPVINNDIFDESGVVHASNMPQGKAIKLIHKGGYENLVESYEKLNAYIYEHQLTVNGNSWEDYVTDPAMVSDEDLITHLFQPIK